MNQYTAFFLYNNRGTSTIENVVACAIPDGLGIDDIRRGFWITDEDLLLLHQWEVKFAVSGGTMWVPPGRITSVVRRDKEIAP
jgi:hypothetical protein